MVLEVISVPMRIEFADSERFILSLWALLCAQTWCCTALQNNFLLVHDVVLCLLRCRFLWAYPLPVDPAPASVATYAVNGHILPRSCDICQANYLGMIHVIDGRFHYGQMVCTNVIVSRISFKIMLYSEDIHIQMIDHHTSGCWYVDIVAQVNVDFDDDLVSHLARELCDQFFRSDS